MKSQFRMGASFALLLGVLVGACSPADDNSTSGTQDELSAEREDVAKTTEAWKTKLSARALRGLAISPVKMSIAGQPLAALERVGVGSYLVNAAGDCSGCHSLDPRKFLAGGTAFPIDGDNVVYTRNLTPDHATGLKLTESQFIAALRTGKDFKNHGQMLVVMPWLQYRWLSLSDLRAIYAYLRVIPAQSNAVPADVKASSALNGPPLPFPGRYVEGDVVRSLPSDVPANLDERGLAIRPLDAPANLSTLSAYHRQLIGRGSYLATVGTCNDCHTNPDRQLVRALPDFGRVNTAAYLSGGRTFDVPPPLQPILHQRRTMSADLTGATHGFLHEPGVTFQRFLAIINSGKHVDENPPRPLGWPMPWDHFRNLLTVDKLALYTYLLTIPPRTGEADKETQAWAPYCTTDLECGANTQTCSVSTNECVPQSCAADTDCLTCQTCEAGACAAPSASSACLTRGF